MSYRRAHQWTLQIFGGFGETVADVHVIPGDPARTPGNYTVQVSIEGADDRRLQLVGEDGRWLDDRLLLSAVRVTD